MSNVENSENVPALDVALRIVRGELSNTRRWMYRVLLMVIFVWVTAMASMWLTEPAGLPVLTNVAFAAMTVIGFGWVGVLVWILTRKSCPTALDRIATGWMATLACSVSLVLSVAVALVRNNQWAALMLAVSGLTMLVAAILLLCSGYSLRRRLVQSLESYDECPVSH